MKGIVVFVTFLVFSGAVLLSAQTLNVRTVFQVGFPVKYSDDPAKPGIDIEVIRAIEKIDPGIHFTGLDIKATTARIMYMLDHNEIDVFFGLARSPDRESKYTWISPVVFTTHPMLFVLKDDDIKAKTIDDIKKMPGDTTILVVAGTNLLEYLTSVGGLKIDAGSTDTPANLQKLLAGRGRFYFGSDLNTFPVIHQLGLTDKIKALPIEFPPADNYAAGPKNANQKIIDRIQGNLKKLQASGQLDAIYYRYLE